MPRDGSNVYHRPSGIDAVTNTTISSVAYNTNVQDVESDLNLPRPIVAGGTGANNAAQAMQNLGGELAKQSVTNYNATTFQAGSFYSATSATGAPVAGHAFMGICYVTDANNMVNEARDQATGINYVRTMTAGSWGSWTADSGPGQFVLKAGDNMTGNLGIAPATGAALLGINPVSGTAQINLNKSASGQQNALYGLMNGAPRWSIMLGNSAAESGSNAGSDFTIIRSNDAGTNIDAPITIARASGTVNIGNALAANGGVFAGYASTNQGTYYFGNDQTKYLNCNGSAYTLGGGLPLYTSNISVSGSLDTSGIIRGGANILSVQGAAGAQPSVGCWSQNRNSAVGIWNATNNTLGLGGMDGSGNPNATWMAVGSTQVTLPSGVAFAMTGGNMSVSGIITGNNVASNDTVRSQNGFYLNGGNAWGMYLNPSTGDTAIQHAGSTWTYWRANDGVLIHYYAGAYKIGAGPWSDASDARIKNVTGDYTNGLDAILALKPVTYTYKGNNTQEPPVGVLEHLQDLKDNKSYEALSEEDKTKRLEPRVPYANSTHRSAAINAKEFIGLIAQDCEGVMPEMVSQSTAFIDGVEVDDYRTIDLGPLTFALVNAVKTLTARIEALEAR